MTTPESELLRPLKKRLRSAALAERRQEPQKDRNSQLIWQTILGLPEYAAARTVMTYLHLPDEVRTQPYLSLVWEHGKQLVVPYCAGLDLGLFLLESVSELAPGAFGILEPRLHLRGNAARSVEVQQLDLVLVPGVAFDRRGGRLGWGKGLYDRLLRRVRPDTSLVGLAFSCQLLPEVPMLASDVYMDKVVTEIGTYCGQRSPSGRVEQ